MRVLSMFVCLKGQFVDPVEDLLLRSGACRVIIIITILNLRSKLIRRKVKDLFHCRVYSTATLPEQLLLIDQPVGIRVVLYPLDSLT